MSSSGIQDFSNRHAERSYATFDVPQYIAINGVFELPFGPGKRFASHGGVVAAIVGGWQINGIETIHSGVPLGFTTAVNTLNNYGGTQRPNIVPGVNVLTPGSWADRVNDSLNPAAFSLPAVFQYGNAPRETNLRAQGQLNLDVSLIRNVKIREHLTLQIRAESFNAMNHVWFGAPNTQVGSQNFGVISTVTNYPRDNQFALKLIF